MERDGADGSIDITIVRAIIETPSADWRILEEDPTIGYIHLAAFTERSNREVEQAIDEFG